MIVRLVASALSLCLVVVLFVVVLPRTSGADWASIWAELGEVDRRVVPALLLLGLAAVWTDSALLPLSMPGLRRGQAFLVCTAGSAMSNMLPFGGVAGTAATFAMTTGWGHSAAATSAAVLVTGACNVVARLGLPLVLLGVAAFGGVAVDSSVYQVGLLVLGGAVVLVVIATRGPVIRLLTRLLGSRVGRAVPDVLARLLAVTRRGWRRMTLVVALVVTMQGALFWACLTVAGASVAFGQVLVVFAVNRMLTLVVVTPGGTGVSENGTIALLLVWGHAAAEAAAGVLLFTLFTYGLEVLAGGVSWSTWVLSRKHFSSSHH